ncbi:MAG: HlyD family efflux transporter periplasmic adaptor subunit [Synergistaceae bacterium]|jgi:HlyD family secretion protein|nr:HlyD family efflux transporter periplasmic adaptor subunit [Synergistaceae bacterium]
MKKFFLLLLLLGAGGAFYHFYGEELFPGARTAEKNLRLYGNVEIRQVLLGFRVPGRLDAIHYEEGQRVSSGDLLGVLDPLPYEIKLAEARAALRQARANLDKMERGYRDEEVRQAVARRDQIRVSLNQAERDHQRLSRLFSQSALSQKDLDAAAARRDQLRAELTSAEAALALTREGYRMEDVKAAEAMVELASARFQEAGNALADTKLYAPSEGVILTRVAEPGSVLAAGQAVYALMLRRPVQVRAYVTEPQLGKIHLGMEGKIFMDSHPDPVRGTISFIASEAEFTPKQVQTEDQRANLVYRVRLLAGEDKRLKNGMPVTVVLDD